FAKPVLTTTAPPHVAARLSDEPPRRRVGQDAHRGGHLEWWAVAARIGQLDEKRRRTGRRRNHPPKVIALRTVLRQGGPSVSRRKSRATGLVACQSLASVGTWGPPVWTRIEPSGSNVQVSSERGAPFTIER